MKKILILAIGCLALGACTHEKKAQALYEKATRMQSNKQYAEAVEIYRDIIKKYPRSSVTKLARVDMDLCKKEHNTPIILKAVDEFPARKFPTTQKGTMPLGKSMIALDRTICNMFKKTAQQMTPYDPPSLVNEARALVKATCSGKYGAWSVYSHDNMTYIVSKTRTGINEKGEKATTNYTYLVDIINNTITAQDFASCFVLEEDTANKITEKGVKKIDVDYSKECVFPIQLKEVLR